MMNNIYGEFSKDKKFIFIDDVKVRLTNLYVFFKGDIYNLNDIKKKYNINDCDYSFIIKKIYKKCGLSFLNELDGNYCIVIYDNGKLHLIKDKLGHVSLFYYKKGYTFIFSTSLKLIMNSGNFKKKISRQVLSNYLGYSYIYEPYTIFEDTYKLKKGTYITYNKNKINETNYYSLIDQYKKSSICNESEEELINDYEKLIYNSITKRGTKDSTVGVFMSSGHDSTLIAKISNLYYDKVNTYTLGFENERDESVGAEAISKYIGTNHHKIILKDKDVLKTIHKISDIYDEPFADPSIIPMNYMLEHIKDKNDFYLAGEGNDAIFINSKMYHIFNFVPRSKLLIKKYINIFNHKRVYRNFDEMCQVNIISRFNYSDKLVSCCGKVYSLERNIPNIRSSVLGDLCNTVSEKYKVKTGSLINHYGYKYATPFYDTSIMEKTFSTDIKMIYKDKIGKYIYKQVLYKFIPKSLFDTYKKNGFGIPVVNWVKNIMIDDIIKYSDESFIKKQGLFSYDEVNKLINLFKEDPNYNEALVLWNYYVFQLWYNKNM